MSDNYFNPVFTDIGRTVAADDGSQGLQTVITQVAFGDAKYSVRDAEGVTLDVAASATSLQSERWRTVAEAGGSPSPGVLNLVAEITKAGVGDSQFFISEVGFFNADGVLVAIWSSDTVNLGYRGDIAAWYLSLGLAWVDLPGDMFTVEVLNAPLSQQILWQARIKNQLSDFVVSSGIEYLGEDKTVLTRAIGLTVSNVLDKLNETVRPPIAVWPANADGVELTPTLTGSGFFSIDSFDHIGSRFIVYGLNGDVAYDSGELGPVTKHKIPYGVLAVSSDYEWCVSYKGGLGGNESWSLFSERSAFSTSALAAYNNSPVLLAPADGIENVNQRPVLTISDYSVVPEGYDVVDGVQFQIYSDAEGSDLIWDSGVVNSVFTSIEVAIDLGRGGEYYWTARHRGTVLGWTEYAQLSQLLISDLKEGVVMEDGGIVVGQTGGDWLIVAPASSRKNSVRFGLYDKDTALQNVTHREHPDPNTGFYNTSILIDGYSNYADGRGSMGPVAAKHCHDLGNGYSLPNKEEVEQVLSKAAEIDAVDSSDGPQISSAGFVWSSTEQSSVYSWACRINANSSPVTRDSSCRVVPVRRVPV